MNRYHRLLLIAAVTFSGCKKDKTDIENPAGTSYTFDLHFANSSSTDFNYRLYDTEEDYYNDANPLLDLRLNAGVDTVVVFKSSRVNNFYFDAFDDSYSYSSWVSFGSPSPTHRLETFPMKFDMIMYAGGLPLGMRKVCLQGNRRQTHWHAIDAFNTMTMASIWGNLDEYNRYHYITFDKNKTFTYITKGQAGNELKQTGGYFITSYNNVSNTDVISLLGTNYEVSNTAGSPGNSASHPSKDTIMLRDDNIYWRMVRD